MNRVTILGRLAEDAKGFLVNTGDKEMTMLSFSLLDYGTPGQKKEPVIIEVHFMNDVSTKLLPDLEKGKEVLVDGFLTRKDYTTRSGVEKSKLYISASIVEFTGCSAKAEGGEYGRNNYDGCY